MKHLLRLGLVPLALALLCGLAAAGPYYTSLKLYIGMKNYERAVSVGEQALEGDGDNPDVYNKYAIALAETDSLDHAGRMFADGLALAKKNNDEKAAKDIETNTQHYYAKYYLSGSVKLQDGTSVLDSLGPHADASKPAVKAAMDGAQAKFSQAVAELSKARSIRPKDPKVWLQMGVAYSSMGDEAQGIECYKKALEFEPGYEQAVRNLRGAQIRAAEKYKAAGKWQDAANVFEGLWQGGDTASLQDLGDIYYNLGKAAAKTDTAAASAGYHKSASYYALYYGFHPEDTLAEFNYIVALENAKDYPTAIQVTKKIVARNPMLPGGHAQLSDALALSGAGTSTVMGERIAESALLKGKQVSPAALKPPAASAAAKLLAKNGRPDKAFAWTDNTLQYVAYFYVSKGEVYGFISDQQVGKSSWLP